MPTSPKKANLKCIVSPLGSVSPERVSGLTYAGFDVISFASEPGVGPWGVGLFETIKTLTKNDIRCDRRG